MNNGCRLLVTAALVVCAAPAQAAGINLSWDDCGTSGSSNRTFACNTNTASHVLVGSFVPPEGIEAMFGNDAVIDVQSACSTFPNWWAMRTGSCRAGSLGYSFDFTLGPSNCYDYWHGGALGGIFMEAPFGRAARILVSCALPLGDPRIVPLPSDIEVYSFKVVINSAKTIGSGSCSGCIDGACVGLNSIRLNQGSPLPNFTLTSPVSNTFATWQSGSVAFTVDGPVCFGDCPTPARNRTWGTIKTLYR